MTLHILLVEDSTIDVMETQRAFLGHDVTITVATDGEEALRVLSAAPPPELVLLDLNLPRVRGLEVLRRMKADPHMRVIPVVVLTSSDNPDDIERSYASHASAFVTKPTTPGKLEEIASDLDRFWSHAELIRTRVA